MLARASLFEDSAFIASRSARRAAVVERGRARRHLGVFGDLEMRVIMGR
jgi:hypothetical protein